MRIRPTAAMFLREATSEDADVLLRLMRAAFKEYEGLLGPPSAAHRETIETVLKRLVTGSAALVTVESEPAGFVFYEPRDTHLYFSRLSVLPRFRKIGVGRALIDYVERRAQEVGAAGVRLGVRVQLPHLIARYERLGYRITQHMTHPGYQQPTYVYMEKVSASGLR